MSESAPSTCPRCGRPRPAGSTDCPGCGVVYGRFRAITRPAPQRAARPAPAPAPAPAARPAAAAVHVSGSQAENVLRLLAHALDSGLTPSAFARSGGLAGLPRQTAVRLTADADAGVPLSTTLEELGLVDAPAAGLLRAKEVHGGQSAALVAIADRMAGRRKARGRLLGIAIYPYFLTLALATLGPLPVAFSQGLSAYLAKAMPPLAALLGLPFALFGLLPRLDPRGVVAGFANRLLTRIPLLGFGARHDALAGFADVLGASLGAGVSVREALPLAAQAGSALPGFEAAIPRMLARLDGGATLAATLAELPGLPPLLLAQVASGESSGRLDAVLARTRQDLEDKARAGWIGLAVAVGALLTAAALGAMAWQIVSGFKEAMGTLGDRIDQVAPPP